MVDEDGEADYITIECKHDTRERLNKMHKKMFFDQMGFTEEDFLKLHDATKEELETMVKMAKVKSLRAEADKIEREL